ncbi:MAG: 50S ribosomal protein L4 [SAR324 cluster bacterium]|nr:50S ribosomal protein L4 [SAR324 cluster bacterium]
MGILSVQNLKGDKVGEFNVADDILNKKVQPYLVKDVVVAYLADLRQGTHSTKGTSDVAGSTRKLYRQKGTGNARVGSAKAINRRHGGVQFGPKPRKHGVKVNKKVSRSVLVFAFAEAIRTSKLAVIDKLALESLKSKHAKELLSTWNSKNVLFVEDSKFDDNFMYATRNFNCFKLVSQDKLNVYDLFKYHRILISEEAIKIFTSRIS